MSIEHVQEMMNEFFSSKWFYRLFFHWSWQVRNIFYYLLVFTINHRLKNKSYVGDKEKITKERIEKLNQGDPRFLKSLNNDYPEQLKSMILKGYYEKLRTIEIIRSIVKKEKLDVTFRNDFHCSDKSLDEVLEGEIRKNVVM